MPATTKLDEIELRVLGALLEKAMSTPEYYPLSQNALVNACNQKNNRDPVVAYDEGVVAEAVASLKIKQLVYATSGGRVTKFGENFTKQAGLLNREAAAIAELLLRGPQTPGELKNRTERMFKFEALEQVEEALAALAELGLAVKLPRQPGRKESRHAHLMGDAPLPDSDSADAAPGSAVIEARAKPDRLGQLEAELAEVKAELAELKSAFLDFKKQFE